MDSFLKDVHLVPGSNMDEHGMFWQTPDGNYLARLDGYVVIAKERLKPDWESMLLPAQSAGVVSEVRAI